MIFNFFSSLFLLTLPLASTSKQDHDMEQTIASRTNSDPNLEKAITSIHQSLTPNKSVVSLEKNKSYQLKEDDDLNKKSKKNNHVYLFGDFIYFKAIEDSIHYAERIPQNATFQPTIKSVDQHFEYKPGFRIGAAYAFDNELWNIRATWMRYYAKPTTRHATSTDFGLLAAFSTPIWGSLGNSEVNDVNGGWKLLMNVSDLDIRREVLFNGFSIVPIAGVKGALIDQHVHVNYGEFLIEFPADVTPRTVKAKSSFWGVGPLLGLELGYLATQQFKLFFSGSFSCLAGNFNTDTYYKDFSTPLISTPSDSVVKVQTSEMLVSLFEQFQAGIDKRWICKSWSLEIAIGWEVQVWQKQMHFNSLSTFVTSPDSTNLNLYGPFVRLKLDF